MEVLEVTLSAGTCLQLSGLIICPFLRPMIDPQSIILLHCWPLIKKHFPG